MAHPTERTTERISLTFERGLNNGLSESMLPDGASSALRNWEPSPTGELRARNPWIKGSTTSAPGTRKGVGLGFFSRLGVPVFVQASDVVSSDNSNLSGTLTFPATTTAGNAIIIVTQKTDSDGATTAAAPTNFTQGALSNDTNAAPRAAIYYRLDAPATTTITLGNIWNDFPSGQGYAQAYEFTGVASVSALDVAATSTDTVSDTDLETGTTASTAQQVNVVIAALGQRENLGDATWTNPTGYTSLGDHQHLNGSNDLSAAAYYKITSATGAQSATATSNTSGPSVGAIVVLKSWHTGLASVTSQSRWLVANNDTTEYDFWAIDREDIGAGTWVNEGSIAVTDPSQHVAMAPGMGRTWITNPQFTSAYVYDGESIEAVTGSPAGRTIAVHKNRVWVAGSNLFPGRLNFSNIANGFIWGSLDYIDVAAEDGEPIEDITPMGELLVIGKRTGLWLLAGSGLDSFDLQKTSTGGLAPGRSLSPTPYGTIAVGRSFIWIIDPTGAVEKISFPISGTFNYTDSTITTSYVDDQFYISEPTALKTWAFNLQTGTWREEDIHDMSSTESIAVLGNHDQTQVFSPKNASTGSLLNYRDFPTTTRGKDFDTLSQVFELSTREIFPVGPEEACTPRHLYLRIRQHGGNASDPGLVVTPQYRELDGSRTSGAAHTITPKSSTAVFRERIDLGHLQGIAGIRFTFEQTLESADAATMDIEEATLEFDVERIR